MKGALGMGHLSLKRLTVEGLEGGLLYWVPWVMKGRLWRGVSLFMGGSILWELCERNLNGGLPCWGPWRIRRKGSGNGHLFPQGPCWGTWKGAHLPGTLREDEGGSRNGVSL